MIDVDSTAHGVASTRRRPAVGWVAAGWARTRALLPQRADLQAVRRSPRRDLLAGVTVAIVALPLALAFGITSGLGAGAGLLTAIVAGFFAAVFGGSNLQVSGPTGAMTVVLVPIVAKFGADGVFVVGMLAGGILIVLAYVRAGRSMRYIPLPVVEGFTIGIGVIITLQQVPAALGVEAAGGKVLSTATRAIRMWFAAPQWQSALVAVVVAAAMLLAGRWRPGFPISLVAIIAVTVVTAATSIDLAKIGAIPSGLPRPALPGLALADVGSLVVPAFAVAALAALESLLSASVADAMHVGERHDSDRELFGQGIANLVSPLFGGIPATAAIARTAVNVRSGAASRLAAVTHAAVLLVIVLVLAHWVSFIPLAALAGVLIATAVQMIKLSSMRALLRSTRADATVLLVTATATVLLDLVTAVIIGFVVAGAAALRQMAQTARLEELEVDHEDHVAEERQLLDERIVAYRLEGPFFFGAAHTALLELAVISDVRVVILRMSRLSVLDATGAAVLADVINRLEGRHISVLLSGIKPEHHRVLDQLGVYDRLAHERHVFEHTPAAIAHARIHALRIDHEPATTKDPTPRGSARPRSAPPPDHEPQAATVVAHAPSPETLADERGPRQPPLS